MIRTAIALLALTGAAAHAAPEFFALPGGAYNNLYVEGNGSWPSGGDGYNLNEDFGGFPYDMTIVEQIVGGGNGDGYVRSTAGQQLDILTDRIVVSGTARAEGDSGSAEPSGFSYAVSESLLDLVFFLSEDAQVRVDLDMTGDDELGYSLAYLAFDAPMGDEEIFSFDGYTSFSGVFDLAAGQYNLELDQVAAFESSAMSGVDFFRSYSISVRIVPAPAVTPLAVVGLFAIRRRR